MNCPKCFGPLDTGMRCHQCDVEGLPPATGYTSAQQLAILCEILQNINGATDLIRSGNFDHAALTFEVAASKLRILEQCNNKTNL